MLLIVDTPNSKDFEIWDYLGRKISGVMSYDTESKEIEMYVADRTGQILWVPTFDGALEPAVAKFKLPNSAAYHKPSGKVVQSGMTLKDLEATTIQSEPV